MRNENAKKFNFPELKDILKSPTEYSEFLIFHIAILILCYIAGRKSA